MSSKLSIQNSTIQDLDKIFVLYRLATAYQKAKFLGNIWPVFDRNMVANEIKLQQQWKLIINDEIACIWATNFNDPQIWEEKDADPAVYIHRIATNPQFRGQHFVKAIVEWAKSYALVHQKRFIRLDTCGRNERLIRHYEDCGFSFLDIKVLKNPEGLPAHYVGAEVCFFEIDLEG